MKRTAVNIVAAIVLSLVIVSCRSMPASTESSSFDNMPDESGYEAGNRFLIEYDEYPEAEVCSDNDDGIVRGVRMYADPSFYRTEDNVNYVALAEYGNNTCFQTSELMNYRIGDEIRIDRDQSIRVTRRIDIDRHWEDMYTPQSNPGHDTEGRQIYRPNGRVDINDEFFCIHPLVMVDPDGTITVMDDCRSKDDWILFKTDPSDYPGRLVYTCDDGLKWYRLSEDCRVILDSQPIAATSTNEQDRMEISIAGLQTAVIDYGEMPDQQFCYGTVFVRGGEVTEIDVFYNWENVY